MGVSDADLWRTIFHSRQELRCTITGFEHATMTSSCIQIHMQWAKGESQADIINQGFPGEAGERQKDGPNPEQAM